MPSLKQAIARSIESMLRSFRKTSNSAEKAVILSRYHNKGPLTVASFSQSALFNVIQLITKNLRCMMPAHVTVLVILITKKCNVHSSFRQFAGIDRFYTWWSWGICISHNSINYWNVGLSRVCLFDVNVTLRWSILSSVKRIYVKRAWIGSGVRVWVIDYMKLAVEYSSIPIKLEDCSLILRVVRLLLVNILCADFLLICNTFPLFVIGRFLEPLNFFVKGSGCNWVIDNVKNGE